MAVGAKAKKLDLTRPVMLTCGTPVTLLRTDLKADRCIVGTFIEPRGARAGQEVVGDWYRDGVWGAAPSATNAYNLVN